jgi:hypothetical protein
MVRMSYEKKVKHIISLIWDRSIGDNYHIHEEYSHSRQFCDGGIYSNLSYYQRNGNEDEENKWQSEEFEEASFSPITFPKLTLRLRWRQQNFASSYRTEAAGL